MPKLTEKKFLEIMTTCASVYRQEADKAVMRIFWDEVSPYPANEVEIAFKKHLRLNKFFPTIAEIIENIPSAQRIQHVGADEAWAIAKESINPSACVCTTAEIIAAVDAVWGVYNPKDENPARMAFRESYNRIVKQSTTPPKWFISLGDDKSAAEGVALKAVQLGRLSPGSESKYRIEPPQTTALKLIEGYVERFSYRTEGMARLKEILKPEPKKSSEKIQLSDSEYAALPWYLRETGEQEGIDRQKSKNKTTKQTHEATSI